MVMAMADDDTAFVAIHVGITPAVLENADRETLVKLSRVHAFSVTDLRALALRWGLEKRNTPASPAKDLT